MKHRRRMAIACVARSFLRCTQQLLSKHTLKHFLKFADVYLPCFEGIVCRL